MNILGIDFEEWFHPELVKPFIKNQNKEMKVSKGIKKILDWLNKNETYLMIGDSLDDCSAASDNNIDFVYCDYGFGHLSLIKERVHCKINQFNDLIKIKGAINVRKY